jgi:dTMP kinase
VFFRTLDVFGVSGDDVNMEKAQRLIAFEGLDGSGQTTQATMLADRLQKDGHKVHLTKEPTNNLVGGIIRGALTKEWKASNHTLQLLYAADRGHHLDREILPALENGFIVITDRYYFSSIAFGSLDCEIDWLRDLNKHFPEPALALYIDVSPEAAINRIHQNRFGVELFEEKEKLGKVSQAYKKLGTEYPQFHSINGERTIEEIHRDVYALVKEHLNV